MADHYEECVPIAEENPSACRYGSSALSAGERCHGSSAGSPADEILPGESKGER
jgi:hypothetical protein